MSLLLCFHLSSRQRIGHQPLLQVLTEPPPPKALRGQTGYDLAMQGQRDLIVDSL